ncbi:molybdate ABC transporter permease subunit [Pseudoroseicyclus tamaricis]|uniref:Molybdenum transport system permease n=1 Tax=Pseudoroseicyclus tamaricis TaxID=2705421 RepID=A0A6B2JWT7_9RHOB|nr:molybdate ABC transporter permease subunit [Pseudoroseicyclus tamaricis]NDV01129.1 molybdate ABC transporter permease subunit [Pseudoroseicyclus tamaricis]
MSWLGPEEWQAVALSFRVAICAALLSLPFGLAAAWALARGRFPGRGLFSALVHLPLVLPPVVTGYLLLLAFGPEAPAGRLLDALGLPLAFRWTGAVLAAAVMGFPLMVRAIRLSLEAVDRRLEEAAGTLGASRARTFATVTLPLIAPGLLAGLVLAFAKALGEFGATITFVANIPGETRTIASAIHAFLQAPGGETAAIRLTLVSIALSLAALLLSEWLAARMARRVGA